MARGIEFEALGKRWSLRMSITAICSVEAELRMTFDQALKAVQSGSILTLRMMLSAGLGGKLPAEKVSDIIEDIGLERAGELIGEAIALAFPQPDAESEPDLGN